MKDTQNKCTVDQMWARFLQMNDRETCRTGTNDPLINNKQELISIVESLERGAERDEPDQVKRNHERDRDGSASFGGRQTRARGIGGITRGATRDRARETGEFEGHGARACRGTPRAETQPCCRIGRFLRFST